jgi:hypothetical protein
MIAREWRGTIRAEHVEEYIAYTRVAQRLLAMVACIWHNWATDAPVKRSLIAYDN